ncbi:L-2-hydroxyglutarate dehydrogenase, mitochondrial-like [Tribolium madens]|uniref:L-2-hydroxyglutarate dehydrogenase, mitochondrial-like n=1 Tax=Tribolium madens TaxID=41895 RepID=UPI001CF72B0C|nr:L-2-hydroxyglutarate dehydrogenase, mitochondrial-like [Tribolium madens]
MMSGISKEILHGTKRWTFAQYSNKFGKILNATFSSTKQSNQSEEFDVVVVGGGIVGAASAREILLRHKSLRMAIVEKEPKLAVHQSGHNSGVIHAGIYYKPGSLKAKLCVEGLHLAYKYCDEKKIPYKKVGKLIVATNSLEQQRLADLHDRGLQNKVPDLKVLKGVEEIKKIEPYCQGVEALWSPHTGIVDWGLVTEYYGKDFKDSGGDIFFNFEVNGFKESSSGSYPVNITAKNGKSLNAKYVLTCGGLYSDKLSELSGCPRDPKIVPIRGEYLLLNPKKCHMVKGNIYPVPDPRFPFLGVHYTPRMDGSVWLGPNAVPAFRKEGYTWFDINVKELVDAFSYRGFQKLIFRNVGYGVQEVMKSAFSRLQLKDLQKYIPEVTAEDIKRGPAGVRAQALDINGNLVDDFVFDLGKEGVGKRILHCRNAPSPGATSSLAIAKMVADRLEKEFELKK